MIMMICSDLQWSPDLIISWHYIWVNLGYINIDILNPIQRFVHLVPLNPWQPLGDLSSSLPALPLLLAGQHLQ